MNEQIERRSDMDSRLTIRIAVLESKQEEALRIRVYHEAELARLAKKDEDMLTALNTIINEFNGLRKQISTGFNVLCYAGCVIVVAVGAFWTYSLNLDQKYAPKLEQVSQEVLASKDHIQQQKQRVANVVSDVEVIKRKRVVKASK